MASQIFSYIFFFSFHLYIICAHVNESTDNKISSPVQFLIKLSGIQKGDHRNGVNELKKHLLYLGYMNYDDTEHNHENDNLFDDYLEVALMKYQKFYNLSITGALDSNTISKLREPRCGLPDFYNPNKTATQFHIGSHYSFYPGNPRWAKNKLKYGFNNVNGDAAVQLELALKQWASSTHFKFYRVKNLNQADIVMSFLHGDHGDGHPFNGNPNDLAHTFGPPDGRVHFDADVRWSTLGARDAFDIQTIGMHELGHALGLGHSNIREAIMYPTVQLGEIKGIHEDDISGIRALYGY